MDFVAMRNRLVELNGQTWRRLRLAARAGNAEAQYLLGSRLNDCRLPQRHCARWLRAAAAQDHPEALYCLAMTTFKPWRWGGPLNRRQRQLLVRAAELGSLDAQRDLAVCYIWGHELRFPKDWALARSWYRRAAEGGHQEAQVDVGSMMLRGEGGPVEVQRGLAFLRLAAEGPDDDLALTAVQWLGEYTPDFEES